MADKKSILFIVSNTRAVNNLPCGVCLEEFAIPYLMFLKAEFQIFQVIVSALVQSLSECPVFVVISGNSIS